MAKHYDVIIIGAGPAGIFSALELAKAGCQEVLIIDKGLRVDQRICIASQRDVDCQNCQPCSVVSGWGGAGAFSDGKLTLTTEFGGNLADYTGNDLLQQLLEEVDALYCSYGATPVLYAGEPDDLKLLQRQAAIAELQFLPARVRHLGSERTKEILQKIYDDLLPKVDIITGCQVESLLVEDGKALGVATNIGTFIGNYIICAPGREGSRWFTGELNRLGLSLDVNPVDIGVRVEVPAATLEEITDKVYESKLVYYSRSFDDKVRTFCMNPRGEVVMENNGGIVTVNGHSYGDKKTENTNFALLVSKNFTQPFKEPIAYGRSIAALANMLGGGVILQRLGDLLAGRRSTVERIQRGLVKPTMLGATPGDLSLVLPYRYLQSIVEMLEALDKMAPGVNSRHTLLYGVEVKFYSSRPKLSKDLETKIANLFAIGDGAGVTRGLAQASASGLRAARAIISRENCG